MPPKTGPESEEGSFDFEKELFGEKEYAKASRAAATRRAYASDWRHFHAWSKSYGSPPFPAHPETVAAYLKELAQSCRTSTIGRRLAAIAAFHRERDRKSPTEAPLVRAVWRGIRRELGVSQKSASPTLTDEIRKMLSALPEGPVGVRDRAILLLCYAGALRRSELVALTVDCIDEVPEGVALIIRRSKTDQEGRGRTIGIPYGEHEETCPVKALARWFEESGIREGPVFRAIGQSGRVREGALSDRTVARIVQKALEKAGINPDGYAAHSLRAGSAVQASMGGASEYSIQAQTGIRSEAGLKRYTVKGSLFRDNAAKHLGL